MLALVGTFLRNAAVGRRGCYSYLIVKEREPQDTSAVKPQRLEPQASDWHAHWLGCVPNPVDGGWVLLFISRKLIRSAAMG